MLPLMQLSPGIDLSEGSELQIDGGGAAEVMISGVMFSDDDGGTVAVNANTQIDALTNDDNNSFTIAFSAMSDTLDIDGGLDIDESSIMVSGTGGTLRNSTTPAGNAVTMTDSSGVLTLNSAGLNIAGGLSIGNE